MTHRLTRGYAVLAGLITLLGVALALALSAPQASASDFCGGQTLSNFAYCYGAARSMTGDSGYGVSHSICIGAGAISGGCSTGPGAVKTMQLGGAIYGQPWIEDNAAGSTVVYGNTF